MFNTFINIFWNFPNFPRLVKQSTHRLLSGLITTCFIFQINFYPFLFLQWTTCLGQAQRCTSSKWARVCLAISLSTWGVRKNILSAKNIRCYWLTKKVYTRTKLISPLGKFPTIFTHWWKTCNSWLDLQFLTWGHVTLLNMLTKVVKL